MDRARLVGLDFETYADISLPDVGLMNYVNHPTFMVTLGAIATDQGTDSMPFVFDKKQATEWLQDQILLPDVSVCAHNAGFERAVLRWLGIHDVEVLDSAVVARVAGANGHLAQAAKQLLDSDKLDEDRSLMRLFAVRQKDQLFPEFDIGLIDSHPDKWQQYREYCERDARLSRELVYFWGNDDSGLFEQEMNYARLTLEMNETGWPVNMDVAIEMQRRYQANLEQQRRWFADNVDAELNLNSHDQLTKWCEKRGIRSKSFDKQNVERMIKRLRKRFDNNTITGDQLDVLHMLETKQILGGSSLSKLEVILRTAHKHRVYDQYVHAGAMQSLRTSGRSIQMQNLPRFTHAPADTTSLFDSANHWTNDKLGENLRQVFEASDPDGLLFVADFASIESRGLAWLAGEDWKLASYRQGMDLYKVLAAKIYNEQDVNNVDADQRRTGKVGELSCGYGAGPGAVADFAAKMGVDMSEAEAKRLVYDWRDACGKTTTLWKNLHEMLTEVVQTGIAIGLALNDGHRLTMLRSFTPDSLMCLDRSANSVTMRLINPRGVIEMERVFHGCYMRGDNVGYYKPSSLKGGDPWKKTYVDPKTKLTRKYELYGGKLAGILTQSLCREIFFESLDRLATRLRRSENTRIIGQFHDEIIVEWGPGPTTKTELTTHMVDTMSNSYMFPGLPMNVEVKSAKTYIK